MAERVEVTINGTAYTVEIDSLDDLKGGSFVVRVNGRSYAVQLGQPARESAPAVPAPAAPAPAEPVAPARKPAAAATGVSTGPGQRVTAPMPGKILSVAVQVGDQVRHKDTLCTLEAMKMEMNIAAPAAGTVREVRAQVGENVAYGDLLFVIE